MWNAEFGYYVEFTGPRGLLRLLSRAPDEILDFFKKLAWDTYEFKQARGTLGYLSHDKYAFHVTPYHQDHFKDSYDHLSHSIVISF